MLLFPLRQSEFDLRLAPADEERLAALVAVTVVGLATDYCVKNTALDALRAGFQVTVDSNAVRGVEVQEGDSM